MWDHPSMPHGHKWCMRPKDFNVKIIPNKLGFAQGVNHEEYVL